MKTQEKSASVYVPTPLESILILQTKDMRALWKTFVESPHVESSPDNTVDRFYGWYHRIEDRAKKFVSNLQSGKDAYRVKHLHPRIAKKVTSIPNNRAILDIGCGTGDAVIPNLKSKQLYVGVDISRYCLEHTARQFKVPFCDSYDYDERSYKNRILTLGALPYSMRSLEPHFDEVLASMVLQDIDDYQLAVGTMMRTVKSGGNYFVALFNSDKRAEIENAFSKIQHKEGSETRGDFLLPNRSKLKDCAIRFHDVDDVHKELREYSSSTKTEECGGIFQIIEGVKR